MELNLGSDVRIGFTVISGIVLDLVVQFKVKDLIWAQVTNLQLDVITKLVA